MVEKLFKILDIFRFVGFCWRAIKRGVKKGKQDALLIDNMRRFNDAN